MSEEPKQFPGVERAATDEALEERMRAARERKEARERERERATKLRELEIVELEQRLEDETGGPRGKSFEILETTEGPIAVVLGPAVLHKRFRESKMKEADIHDFVAPCVVHPEKSAFLELVGKRPGIMVDLGNILADLFAGRANERAGKR